jgi:heme oxygenase
LREAPPKEAQRPAEVVLSATEAGQSQSALIALRRATAQSHAAIDRLLGIDAYLERARYVRILAAFDGFYRVWEPRIEAALPEPWARWFLARSRRPFLERDMAVLEAMPFALSARLTDRMRFDAGDDADAGAAAFGSMYVLEGSSLGGVLIAERVVQALGITPANGGAYFAGWGADTGRLWREFRQVLESQLVRAESIRVASESAVETFDVLINVFSEALDDRTC